MISFPNNYHRVHFSNNSITAMIFAIRSSFILLVTSCSVGALLLLLCWYVDVIVDVDVCCTDPGVGTANVICIRSNSISAIRCTSSIVYNK